MISEVCMKRIFYKEFLFFLGIVIVYNVLSYAPVVRNFRVAPPDRYYWGADDFPFDTTGNLTNVREGYNGHWLRFSKFTSTIEGPPTLLKFEYILVGQFARLFRSDPLVMYYITRTILSLVYFGSIFIVVRKFFRGFVEQGTAYILLFFATSITIPNVANFQAPDGLLYDTRALIRYSQATHHYLLGGIFALLSLWFLAKVLDKPKALWAFVTASLLGFLCSWVYAPNSIVILSGFPLFFAGKWFSLPKSRRLIRFILIAGILFGYAAFLIAPIVYVKIAIQGVWDWNVYAVTEKLVPFTLTLTEYLYVMGLVYPFAALSVPSIVRSGNTFLLLIVPWVVMHPVGTFFLTDLLGINKLRYFLSFYFVVFGLLAAVGIRSVAEGVAWVVHRKVAPVTMILLTALVIVSSYETYIFSWGKQNICYCTNSLFDYGYPKKDLMGAIFWLRDTTKEGDIVLSGAYAGTLVPAFAGNRVYVTWWFRLSAPERYYPLMQNLERFYRGDMVPTEAKDYLQTNNIAYVLFSEEERDWTGGNTGISYPGLREVFRNNAAVVYAVSL